MWEEKRKKMSGRSSEIAIFYHWTIGSVQNLLKYTCVRIFELEIRNGTFPY